MQQSRVYAYWIFLLLGFSGFAYADPRPAAITGFAHDRQTGEFLYTENHRLQLDGASIVEHKVDYKDAMGRVIASKWLDYSDHLFAPAFELNDLRDGYMEGASHTQNGYAMKSREKAGASIKTGTVPIPEEFVSDSGFDIYVRTRLDEVLANKRPRFEMAVASEQITLRFEAVMLEESRLFDRPAVRIKLQPSMLLRLIVAPIFVTYDIENGELLRYEGLSNIRNSHGKRYNARIDFPPDQQQYAGVRH